MGVSTFEVDDKENEIYILYDKGIVEKHKKKVQTKLAGGEYWDSILLLEYTIIVSGWHKTGNHLIFKILDRTSLKERSESKLKQSSNSNTRLDALDWWPHSVMEMHPLKKKSITYILCRQPFYNVILLALFRNKLYHIETKLVSHGLLNSVATLDEDSWAYFASQDGGIPFKISLAIKDEDELS